MRTIILGNNETRKMFVIIKELLLGKLVGKVYYLLGYSFFNKSVPPFPLNAVAVSRFLCYCTVANVLSMHAGVGQRLDNKNERVWMSDESDMTMVACDGCLRAYGC